MNEQELAEFGRLATQLHDVTFACAQIDLRGAIYLLAVGLEKLTRLHVELAVSPDRPN